MKTLALTIVASLTVLTVNVFAGASSKTLLTCRDQKSRVLTITQLTGVTGKEAGDLVATVQSSAGKLLVASTVMFSHMDVTFPATYGGKDILATVDSIIPMNLAADQRSGSLKFKKEKPVLMTCTIAQDQNESNEDYVCKATVNCMPPLINEETIKYCSADYEAWTTQNCEETVTQLQ